MSILSAILISFILELIEVIVQYSTTLKGSIYRLYGYYYRSSFLFFIVHFGYLWILFVSLYFDNLSWAIILALTLKTLDMFTKIDLMNKLFIKPDREYISELSSLLESKIPVWVYLIGPLTYPYLIYIALKGV